MVKKEVHERLSRFRVFYNVVTFIVFMILLIFDNDLKKSFQEFNYMYFGSFFCLVGISYYLFYTAGKDPGYAVTYDKPREIEMEVASQKSSRSDSSLEVFENTGKENKMSLFNPTDPTSNNEYFSNDSDSDESLENRSDLERNISKDIDSIRSSIHENAHPLLPDQRFCEICDIFQPYRTRHCQLCEKCISKYDHHCVWIGSCVGELNHGKFWLYLFFQNAVIIWTIVIIVDGIVHIFNPEGNDAYNVEYQPLPAFEPYEATRYLLFMIFALVLSTTAFLFTGVLFFFHTYLIMTNQTTWEFARRKTISYLNTYPQKFHPFSKGLWENIKVVFFHKNKIRNWELPSPPPSQ